MTTICFRDGILASDSLVSWCSEAGGGTKYEAIKLYRVTGQLPGTNYGEYLVGIAGSVPAGQSFLEWLQKGGEPPESLVKDRAEADVLLVSKETGKAVVMDDAGAVMLEEYDVVAEVLRADLSRLVDELSSEGLVTVHSGSDRT